VTTNLTILKSVVCINPSPGIYRDSYFQLIFPRHPKQPTSNWIWYELFSRKCNISLKRLHIAKIACQNSLELAAVDDISFRRYLYTLLWNIEPLNFIKLNLREPIRIEDSYHKFFFVFFFNDGAVVELPRCISVWEVETVLTLTTVTASSET